MLAFLLACSADDPALAARLIPDSGSGTGYDTLAVELDGYDGDAPEVTRAWVGGTEAYDLAGTPGLEGLTWQGAEQAGPADLALEIDGALVTLTDTFEVAAPIDPVFDRMIGIGASFTAGVQNGVPSGHGALASPGMLIAKQAGAFYSLPMLVPGLFPEIGFDEVGPPPTCEIPDIVKFVTNASADVIATLSDEDGFTYVPGRETPDLLPRNLAVGGMQVDVLAFGTDSFELNFVAHLVYDPYGELGDPPPYTQLELAVAAEPTLVLSFDLLGNDLIWSVVLERYLDSSKATPSEELRAPLDHIFLELSATGAEIFVANMPDPTVLGVARQKQALMVAEGVYTEEGAEAEAQEIRDLAVAYNAVLAETAAPYPTVHIVDLASVVADVAANGAELDGEHVPITLVGGFVSFDGLHFSNTGYALLADTFLGAINAEIGTDLPHPDLDAIYRADPGNLSTLRAAGFDPLLCE